MEKAANRKDSKSFYKGLKAVFGPKEDRSYPLISSDRQDLVTEKQNIFTQYFSTKMKKSADMGF